MGSITDGGILVLGAGGHGKSVVSVLLASGVTVSGVLDDLPQNWGQNVLGVPILGPFADLRHYESCSAVIGVGENAKRRAVAERFPGVRWVSVLYPGAYINPSASIGPGTVVFPGAIIGADVVIGSHVIVSAHTTVGHDTTLEDYAQAAPGVQIGGGVFVGKGAMLGIGSIVCPQVRIGQEATLGAGAVAIHDIPAACIAFGIPARPHGARQGPALTTAWCDPFARNNVTPHPCTPIDPIAFGETKTWPTGRSCVPVCVSLASTARLCAICLLPHTLISEYNIPQRLAAAGHFARCAWL